MCVFWARFSANWALSLQLLDIMSEPISSFDSGVHVLADRGGVQQTVVVEKNSMVW